MDGRRLHEVVSLDGAPPINPPDAFVFVPGGTFKMGSDCHYPEEAPAHLVSVDGFWIERTPVTNRQFRRFVRETGYVTEAERPLDASLYPGVQPNMLRAGSLVFSPPDGPVEINEWSRWWQFKTGAQWRNPQGPQSSIRGLNDHPVVHISHSDAVAYASWADMDLPTEAEWERAARGGLDCKEFAWGDEFTPGGRHMANTWQGEFPCQNLMNDGFERTSPVTAFPPNGYGIHDMIGNVWEWTADWYAPCHELDADKTCCVPTNPLGSGEAGSYDPSQPFNHIPRKVLKGGSHLCAPNYCSRYRPAARRGQAVDSASSHIGFRCVKRDAGSVRYRKETDRAQEKP